HRRADRCLELRDSRRGLVEPLQQGNRFGDRIGRGTAHKDQRRPSQSCRQLHFLYGLTSPDSSAAKTSRTWRSSQPISTASSSASWANPCNSSRFSLRTLIFSTQETGSPSGVFQVGNLSLGMALLR